MEYAQTDAAYLGNKSGSGSILGGSPAANQIAPSEFNVILKKLDQLCGLASNVASMSMMIGDRLLGPLPESCADEGYPAPTPSGQIGQVHEGLESISRTLNRASGSLERLNRL